MTVRAGSRRQLSPIPIFDEPLLAQLLVDNQIKPSWTTQIWSHILHYPGFNAATDTESKLDDASLWSFLEDSFSLPSLSAPPRLIALLRAHCTFLSSKVIVEQTSSNGSTTKLLIQLQDNEIVESVIIRHKARYVPHTTINDEESEVNDNNNDSKRDGRVTLCFSSQIGCKMACSFCATGTIGLKGLLHSGEIIEQLIHANRRAKIRNLVAMGQGEPLDNYSAVIAAIRLMIAPKVFNLSPNRLTVSTVGVIPNIYKLMYDAPQVSLALSLHASTQEQRIELVPSAASYKYDALIQCIDDYITMMKKSILIEYCIIRDVNDSDDDAHRLGALFAPRMPRIHFNLIPYNPTDVTANYRAPDRQQVLQFQSIIQSYGVVVTIRHEMGSDADAACGQLALNIQAKLLDAKTKVHVPDIEDIERSKDGAHRARSLRKRIKAATSDKPSDSSISDADTVLATSDSTSSVACGGSFSGAVTATNYAARSLMLAVLPFIVIVLLSFLLRYRS